MVIKILRMGKDRRETKGSRLSKEKDDLMRIVQILDGKRKKGEEGVESRNH